jgi:hypothetical protein
MARYSTNNRMAGSQHAITNALVSQVSLTAATATLCRGQIVEIAVGADGQPVSTDCQIVYDVARQTTLGTGTAATPNPENPADVASRSVGTVNYTVEPTVTGGVASVGSLWTRTLNQRAAQQWFANPGSEIVWPATNLNGLVVRALSPTYTNNVLVETRHDDF